MISVAPPALHQALQLLRMPTGARPGPQERLPEGMLLLIRIVAGDELALAEGRQRSEESGEVVREAAAFYIQQVMFAGGSHSYRLLGVDSDAPDERIKEHYRWLVRWLHPDRNADEWEVVYADRVNRAWQDLRTPSRRQRFDGMLAAAAAATTGETRAYTTGERVAVPARHSPVAVATYDDGAAGYNALRWLPKLIFGGLGVCAVLALGLLWLLRAPAPAPTMPSVAATDGTTPAHVRATNPAPTNPPAPVAKAALASSSPASVEAPIEARVIDPSAAIAVAPIEPAVVPASAPARPLAVPSPTAKPTTAPTESKAQTAVVAAPPTPTRAAPLAATRDTRRSNPKTPVGVPSGPAVTAQQTPATAVAIRDEASDPVPALPTIDDRVANRLVGQLSQAYGDGDLQRMRSLVTSNAVGGNGDLLDEYGRLFASSEQRSLSISNVSWLRDGDSATIIATYVATVQTRAGKRARRSGGDMRLDLRVEGGQWRIQRLSHDDRRG